jgi:hypothetical protein
VVISWPVQATLPNPEIMGVDLWLFELSGYQLAGASSPSQPLTIWELSFYPLD